MGLEVVIGRYHDSQVDEANVSSYCNREEQVEYSRLHPVCISSGGALVIKDNIFLPETVGRVIQSELLN